MKWDSKKETNKKIQKTSSTKICDNIFLKIPDYELKGPNNIK